MRDEMKRLLVALLIMCGVTMAAPLPDAPSTSKPRSVWLSPFRDPAFYIGSANYAASAVADVHSTLACEHDRPPRCVEAYRGHDSYGYIAPQIALVAGAAYGCSLMLSAHRHWRWACLVIPVAASLTHWRDATHIYHESPIAGR